MLRGMIVALIVVGLSSSADAGTLLLKDYKDPKDILSKIRNEAYLDGVKAGLVNFAAVLKYEGLQPVFCLPDKLGLTVDQAEDIMMRRAKERTDPDDLPISTLLTEGLIETFPCQH